MIVASNLLNLFCRLDTGYIDLYLIHSPSPGGNVDSYKAMLKLQEEGVLRWSVICYYMKSERNISICNTFFCLSNKNFSRLSYVTKSCIKLHPLSLPLFGLPVGMWVFKSSALGVGIWTMPGCGGKFEPAECICFKNIEELKGKESVSVHKWCQN